MAGELILIAKVLTAAEMYLYDSDMSIETHDDVYAVMHGRSNACKNQLDALNKYLNGVVDL